MNSLKTWDVPESADERNIVVEDNLGLVIFVARKHEDRAFALNVDMEDVISEGVVGLIVAADRFAEKYSIKFSTYAYAWINGHIRNYFRDHGRLIRLPRVLQSEIGRNEAEPVPLVLSLNKQVFEDSDSAEVGELIPHEVDMTTILVKDFIDGLTAKEQKIIRLRMRGLTQQEIASEIGLSQMTVGRVLKDIGKKYMRT